MTAAQDTTGQGGETPAHDRWPRTVIDEGAWRSATSDLVDGRLSLLGLWGDAATVHMAVLNEEKAEIRILSLECQDGRFPSVGERHPPALHLERAINDLFGLEPVGAQDKRPWLDHGRWGVRHPLGMREEVSSQGSAYSFLPAEGESLHQIAVGPVHAGIIEPGHFRFTANGETVVRLEARLGYAHKGIEGLMAGADLDRAAKLAGRVSGDSTVAYALAFARAVEGALEVQVPPRAIWLRALLAEMERLANHLGDIGAICNDASFALMHAHCGILRERTLRVAGACFGHRMMRDAIMPGGVTIDLTDGAVSRLRALLKEVGHRFPRLVALYDGTASLQDRTVGTGMLRPPLARQYGCGGPIGRASGRSFDARRMPGYPPYDNLNWETPVLEQGDVNARIWIRIREVEQSLALIAQILERIPSGPIRIDLPPSQDAAREGAALVEGFRGDILVWLRVAAGKITRCHLRDPSWFQWPLIEAVIEGNIVADFPLCNKSFNCSYSGHDL